MIYAGIGARSINANHYSRICRLAAFLSPHTLRSGGALGADQAFDQGHKGNAQIFIPWNGYNDLWSSGRYMYIQDHYLIRKAERIIFQIRPRDKRPAVNALMARNVFQILGPSLDTPIDFCVACTPGGGGTGVTMALAESLNIPTFNIYYRFGRRDFLHYASDLGLTRATGVVQ